MSNEVKIYPKAGMKLYIALIIISLILAVLAALPVLLQFLIDSPTPEDSQTAFLGCGASIVVLFVIFWILSMKFNSHKDNKSPQASKLLKIGEILGLILSVLGGLLIIICGIIEKFGGDDSGRISFPLYIVACVFIVINLVFSCVVYGIAVSKKRVAYKVK